MTAAVEPASLGTRRLAAGGDAFSFFGSCSMAIPLQFEGGGPAFTREPPQLASIGFLLCDLGIYGPDLIALTNSLRGLDLDATRLHRLRHFALQFDLEQAVFKGSALPLDIVGKVEKRRSNERPAMPR